MNSRRRNRLSSAVSTNARSYLSFLHLIVALRQANGHAGVLVASRRSRQQASAESWKPSEECGSAGSGGTRLLLALLLCSLANLCESSSNYVALLLSAASCCCCFLLLLQPGGVSVTPHLLTNSHIYSYLRTRLRILLQTRCCTYACVVDALNRKKLWVGPCSYWEEEEEESL